MIRSLPKPRFNSIGHSLPIAVVFLAVFLWFPVQASDHFNRLDEAEKNLSAEVLVQKGESARWGSGVAKNYKTASAYYELAAEKGHPLAQYRIALAYRQGYGVDLDQEKAYFWFLKAARQGHQASRNFVGLMFKDGLGVEQNEKEAAKHIRIAAERGNKYAMANLGNFYRSGLGVEIDNAKAYFWYSLSVRHYYSKAEQRKESTGELLTSAEREEIDRRVQSWKIIATPPEE